MNAASVLLEGCREVSGGTSIPLDLSRLEQFSLFPGQVVAVKGVNSTGKSMLVEEIQSGKPLPFPDTKFEIPEGKSIMYFQYLSFAYFHLFFFAVYIFIEFLLTSI